MARTSSLDFITWVTRRAILVLTSCVTCMMILVFKISMARTIVLGFIVCLTRTAPVGLTPNLTCMVFCGIY